MFTPASLLIAALIPLVTEVPIDKPVPPLPAAPGTIQRVADVESLRAALESSPENVTILVEDGIYTLDAPITIRRASNVVLRGAGDDAKKVVIRGRGFLVGKPGDDLIRVGGVENLTIAHLTFSDCRSYGVKIEAESFPKDVHIYGCDFRDIGIRMIKGSTSLEGRAVGGSIRYCRFENTQVPPADWLFDGDYITAIDMMALEDWTIADNLFKNIKGRNGGARGAIFVWVRSRRVTAERNLIIHCDRGISFGNPSGSTNFAPGQEHISDSIIRNNIVLPGPDAGIELWWARDVRILGNTIWREDPEGPGMRGGMEEWPIEGIEVANNFVRGGNHLSGGVQSRTNRFDGFSGWTLTLDQDQARIRLEGPLNQVIGRGEPLEEMRDDFRGHPRDLHPDLGAWEIVN